MGLCGSGIIDVISELFRTEIIDARGKFRKKGRRICHDENGVPGYMDEFIASCFLPHTDTSLFHSITHGE